MAHFKGPQIFEAHFDCIFDVMMTMSLRLGSDLVAAKVISQKKVIASPSTSLQAKSELICKGK